MTVAASIILAAVVGGVIFVLLDSWQRRESDPKPAGVPPEPRVYPPAPPRPNADERWPPKRREELEGSLWSGWAQRQQR